MPIEGSHLPTEMPPIVTEGTSLPTEAATHTYIEASFAHRGAPVHTEGLPCLQMDPYTCRRASLAYRGTFCAYIGVSYT